MVIISIFLVLSLFVYWFWHLKSLWTGKHRRLFALLTIVVFLLTLVPRSSVFFFWLSTIEIIWFAIYLQMSLVSDLGLIAYRLIKRPKLHPTFLPRFLRLVFAASWAVTAVFFSYGVWNNLNYRLHDVEIGVPGLEEEFKVAFFTDIHFSAGFPESKLKRLISDIDSIAPQAVFFGGDVADASDTYLNSKGIDTLFQKIKAPQGFFGVIGNHEGYLMRSGYDFVVWMNQNGMLTLLDSTSCNELFCVSGRLDHQYASHLGKTRMPLDYLSIEVAKQGEKKRPWIVLDHQPKGLEGEKPRIMPDLVISGHTHAGQFFPGNIIIDWIWPLSHGLGYLDGVLWFVSSGIHTWGPPVRVLTHSELVIFNFRGKR